MTDAHSTSERHGSPQSDALAPISARLSLALVDIKLAHSVFALPFAILAAAIAARPGDPLHLHLAKFALIVVCMVAARTVAMLVNRIADRRFDAANPRTARRALASGRLALRDALAVTTAAALIFIAACAGFYLLDDNPWPLILAIPTLALVSFYSFTKRFTAAAHGFLGLALAASPVAAAIAVNPAVLGITGAAPTAAGLAIYALAAFVALWVAGFDILYALQDIDFDQREGLHSIPARLGPTAAVRIARTLHAAAFAFLLLAIAADPRLGWIAAVAAAVVLAALIAEHAVLARRGLAALPMAFFTLNGFISLTLGALGVADLIL